MNAILDRLVPLDWEHVSKHPLSALAVTDRPKGIPVVAGVNWYTDFDTPVKVGNRWFVCPNGKIKGSIRGGHCFCIKASETDLLAWWHYYNQGQEGACVGFGSSRCMSELNRHEYDGTWLYNQAQKIGGYVGQEGAYVRDAMKALQTTGPLRKGETSPRTEDGIAAYRWANSVDEVRSVLNLPMADELQAVPFVNSWGTDYPHVTWIPYAVLDRLIHESGEIAIVTDK